VCNRIAELDRGRLLAWNGDYSGFLRFREQQDAAEQKANALFDKRLAQEEVWIRQGIKARRTRNEGRVRALQAMREERRGRIDREGRPDFALETAEASGRLVAELDHVSKSLGGREIIHDLSITVQRGDRIGIVGANGAGKSTLVRLLLGTLQPDSGRVRLGTRLEIAYSDQLRGSLDPDMTLLDNICGGREFIDLGDRRLHGISYLGDFLFTPEQARAPVTALSGGEHNRAILAKLFSQPANLLVLDEPTNDLDLETLELLEERLLAFSGTVILVSHDRAFMDNVVTSLLVLPGDGSVDQQAGGYSDWVARGGGLKALSPPGTASQTGKAAGADDTPAGAAATGRSQATQPGAKKDRKLSYREQRELDALPAEIERLEQEQEALEEKVNDPAFYEQDAETVNGTLESLTALQAQLDAALERWTELEERA
jgi:ATP-binding cassette subfamily F protein uup